MPFFTCIRAYLTAYPLDGLPVCLPGCLSLVFLLVFLLVFPPVILTVFIGRILVCIPAFKSACLPAYLQRANCLSQCQLLDGKVSPN